LTLQIAQKNTSHAPFPLPPQIPPLQSIGTKEIQSAKERVKERGLV